MEKESSPEVAEIEWYFPSKLMAHEKVTVASVTCRSQKQYVAPALLFIVFASCVLPNIVR